VDPAKLVPAGDVSEVLGPLVVLLLPVAGLFLRDRLDGSKGRYLRWYLLTAALAGAVGAVCTGSLGRTLAKASPDPFWSMSRSISVLGVMERFEALISALLSLGFCCLLALLLLAGRKAMRGAIRQVPVPVAAWVGTGAAAALLWLVPMVPESVWIGGDLIFWAALPVLTLGIVSIRNSGKFEKNA